MSEYNDTPIFAQLARERSYERLIADGPVNLRPAFVGVKTENTGHTPAGAIIDEVADMYEVLDEAHKKETVQQTDEAVNAAAPIQKFVSDAIKEFHDEHPNAMITGVDIEHDNEGQPVFVLTGLQPTTIGEDRPDCLTMIPDSWKADDEE